MTRLKAVIGIPGAYLIKHFYYIGLKEWQSDEKKERLIDVFLSMQDDMKAILNYFRIDYDKTELKAREVIRKHM